ncbi:MAG: YkgJ family cysteine cluster protein [Saprospiraceae bacterium]|nr:YkgJ family cysteine cluster protein [Saprospiraceae bacterium]
MTEADQNLLLKAKDSKKENEIWFRTIRNVKTDTLHDTIISIHQEVFAKTDCMTCANCCKTSPPLLTNEDINRISKSMGISAKQFTKSYVLQDFNGEKTFNIVPCKFLQSDNTCSIYDIRPEACRRYPHTDEMEYPKRTHLNVSNTLVCPAAYNILEKLKSVIHQHDLRI